MIPPPTAGTPDGEEVLLAARAAELARPLDDLAEAQTVDLIPFIAAGQAYAVPAAAVREVRRLQVLARLPRAPASLLGVTRVRSTVVPVFDLPRLLELGGPVAAAPASWVLVLDVRDQPVLGLAAESVDGVQPYRLADIAPSSGGDTRAALGVTPQGVVVLEPDALLAAPAVFAAPTPADVSQQLHTPTDGQDPQRGTS